MLKKLRRILYLSPLFLLVNCEGDGSRGNAESEFLSERDACRDISFNSELIGNVPTLSVQGKQDESIIRINRSDIAYPPYLEKSEEIYSGLESTIYDYDVLTEREYYYTLYLNDRGVFLPCISTSLITSDPRLKDSIVPDAFKQINTPGTDTAFDFVSRIPSVIAVKKGALVAFVERRSGPSDSAKKSIIMSRSYDNGMTWSAEETIVQDGANSVGNPTAIYDQSRDKITLMFSNMLEGASEGSITDGTFSSPDAIRIMVTSSLDGGSSWSQKVNITESISRPDFTFRNVGPGTGIITSKGRYIFPAYHATRGVDSVGESSQSYMIISDDGGNTFYGGGDIGFRTDENQIIELENGNLRAFIRYYGDQKYIATADSDDDGLNWTVPRYEMDLPTSIVQQSVIRLTQSENFVLPRVILSNPADQTRRDKLTLKVSHDETVSWSYEKVVYAVSDSHPDNWVGYSSLVILNDKTIGILFEKYEDYEFSIVFSRYNINYLSNENDIFLRR